MLNNHSTTKHIYQEVKSKLIKLAVEVSKNLTTYALLEEMVELQAQFCYTPSELQCYADEVLTLKCNLLYKKLSEFGNDLDDYNITQQKLEILHQTIDDFQNIAMQLTVMQSGLMENEPV